MTTDRRPLLTSSELADRWGIHESTIANWRVTGKGPHYLKIRGLVLYRLSHLEAWEASRTDTNTSEIPPRDSGQS